MHLQSVADVAGQVGEVLAVLGRQNDAVDAHTLRLERRQDTVTQSHESRRVTAAGGGSKILENRKHGASSQCSQLNSNQLKSSSTQLLSRSLQPTHRSSFKRNLSRKKVESTLSQWRHPVAGGNRNRGRVNKRWGWHLLRERWRIIKRCGSAHDPSQLRRPETSRLKMCETRKKTSRKQNKRWRENANDQDDTFSSRDRLNCSREPCHTIK